MPDEKRHYRITLTIKSTSGQFTDEFNLEARAQHVLDEAIRRLHLASGPGITYVLRREVDGRTLALSEELDALDLSNGDVILLQTTQAQDG